MFRHDGLVFDGRQAAEAVLVAAAVVGAFDPGHDGDQELLAGVPPFPVQDVLLEHAEEGFDGGVVTSGADSARGSDRVVSVQVVAHLAGRKFGPAIGMRGPHRPSRGPGASWRAAGCCEGRRRGAR